MTTYVYETIPLIPGVEPRRFEVRQSMKDAPLTHHPETGEPVRRVIAGGMGIMTQKAVAPRQHSCGAGCGCGRN